MLLKILLLSIVTGIVCINTPFNIDKTIKYDEVVTTESTKQRIYRHDVLAGNAVVSYKFETNEVTTYDDLVIGNIYHYSDSNWSSSLVVSCSSIYNLEITTTDNEYYSIISCENLNYLNYQANYVIGLYVSNNTNHNVFSINHSNVGDFLDISFDFVCNEETKHMNNYYLSHISSTEFNIIESVTYTQPTTIIGYINEFLENNLLGEIPFIRDINFEIGGQNINLLTWVIMAIGLVIVGLLIFAFIKLIIWLVKLFSNSFLLR